MCSRYYYDHDALREIVSPVWKGDALEAWLLDEVFAEKILEKVPEQLQQFREYEQQSLF